MRDLFYKMPRNILRCFQGYNILWHLLTFALTYLIVTSGLDWLYFLHARSFILSKWLSPAIFLGGILPILIPLTLILTGWLRRKFLIKNAGLALAQAAMIGLFISSFYKALTGRVHPPRFLSSGSLMDISHQFRFGFLRGGVFWGWPSSHTTIAFAMAMTLFTLYPKNKLLRILVLAYAIYIGLGVSISIHWFSEAIAGAIIGSVIGTVVGKYFLQKTFLIKNPFN
jgi:membrane-associated phospholipid phosphatase